jgi:hypothetical protein
MKVSNQTSDQDQVKICLYKPSDSVDWIPVGAGVFVVTKGDTVTWTPPSGEGLDQYWLKAFHPAFFDRDLANKQVGVNDSLAVRGGDGSYSVDNV